MKFYRTLFAALVLVFSVAISHAHPWKPDHYVIIDTDGGIDDMRAITLMLASPEVRVLAITASSGVLPAKEAYFKVRELLLEYHHEGILTGVNEDLKSDFVCEAASNFHWGTAEVLEDKKPEDAAVVIAKILNSSEEGVEFVSLGSLNTIASFLSTHALLSKKVTSIYWSINLDDISQSLNYKLDKKAYKYISTSTNILTSVHCRNENFTWDNFTQEQFLFPSETYKANFYRSIEVKADFSKSCFDENIVLMLHDENREFFTRHEQDGEINFEFNAEVSNEQLALKFRTILNGETINRNQVFKTIPSDTTYYQHDVQEFVERAYSNYGKEEWQAAVLANEMHRHLGAVATIGVKMGIRAREYFGAGIDEMYVVSYAGLNPPVSCMNDGLQVSTGATVGHGLIEVDTSSAIKPEAVFNYRGRQLKISLKEEYRKKLFSELKELNTIYGLNSDIYWELVRNVALKYWATWSRYEIFELNELP
ncbi:MAG: nucleoside hydrolase [Bacteroidales bacterium]|nr:nucleoside hydrolase [Bacteroidales bacterium]MBN2818710.1 nucleoside hydrolase [Bacteroidales bacterium]